MTECRDGSSGLYMRKSGVTQKNVGHVQDMDDTETVSSQ